MDKLRLSPEVAPALGNTDGWTNRQKDRINPALNENPSIHHIKYNGSS